MKVFRTIMWALILVLSIIATFYLFTQVGGLNKIFSYQSELKAMINGVFRIKGYVLTNITLIGAYIIKLIEIWGKKDE